MRHVVLGLAICLAFSQTDCSCSHAPGIYPYLDAGTNHGIVVLPQVGTVDIVPGGPPGNIQFKAYTASDDRDVSDKATWTIDDPSVGTIAAGGHFTSVTPKGGSTQVHARLGNLSGDATANVRLHVVVTSGCPSCPKFPDPPAKPCPTGTAPTIVYPPDGVLVPPNMNVMEVHFVPGAGTMYYEVDFESGAVDVRVATLCNPVSDTRNTPTGGCAYALDPAVWGYVSNAARGGEPVQVSVRATTDGSCASPSANRNVSFAEQDLNGGLYYWQSLVVGGVAGKTGGIFRYDFGSPGQTGQPYLTPASGFCVGCHFLSRDGTRMSYSTDDADSDDEYGDMHAHLIDVASKMTILTNPDPLPPGFQTFNHDSTRLMTSTGQAQVASFDVYDAQNGGAALTQMMTGMRATQPDWGPDDKTVVFVVPQKFSNQFLPTPYKRADDDHFMGGSLFTASFDGNQFGAPQALIQSKGENNYYPQLSPDTPPTFLIFNRVDDPAANTDLAKDAFNNPYAKVFIMPFTAGANPIDATALNGDPKSTNSWPRWSPFVQTYRGQRLLWVTFSSTRDYGLRVRNHDKVSDGMGGIVDQVNCYPPDSPQNLTGSHQQPLPPNCNQPQIWMAAINLSSAEVSAGDPSYPAFWLPFQDVTAHNHIAQWVQTVVGTPSCDGGTAACIPDGMPCGGNICGVCCNADVCTNNLCTPVIQ
jgi:hypothetical protein